MLIWRRTSKSQRWSPKFDSAAHFEQCQTQAGWNQRVEVNLVKFWVEKWSLVSNSSFLKPKNWFWSPNSSFGNWKQSFIYFKRWIKDVNRWNSISLKIIRLNPKSKNPRALRNRNWQWNWLFIEN